MFQNNIIYKRNIIVVVKLTGEPRGISTLLTPLDEGLELLVVYVGYMEIVDIDSVLKTKGIEEKTIFYGQEEIVSKNPIWNLFGAIKNLSPSFVSFYNFPHQKLIGVIRRVEI
jgi:KUP system potassium uptake protein